MADRVNAVGNEVRASGRWNGTYQEWGGGPKQAKGYWASIVVREGDTWGCTPKPSKIPSGSLP